MAILWVPWVIPLPLWVVPQTPLRKDIVDSPAERRLTQMVFQNPLVKLLLFLYVLYISCRWLNGLNTNSKLNIVEYLLRIVNYLFQYRPNMLQAKHAAGILGR